MAASDQRTKSQHAAAMLLARGIYHGKRLSRPAVNSGGLNMSAGPGSAKYQRLLARKRK